MFHSLPLLAAVALLSACADKSDDDASVPVDDTDTDTDDTDDTDMPVDLDGDGVPALAGEA